MPRIAFVLPIVISLLAPGALLAQQEPPPPPEPRPGTLSPGELQNMFDAYALVQAQDALRLTDAQYAQFVTRMRALQQARRRGQQERLLILRDLGRLAAEPTIDEALVKERLKALADYEQRAAAELRKAYESLDEVLDVRQRARLRVFEERMEQRKFELLMRARQANRPNQQRRIPR